MARPMFSVVVPTLGRSTLRRTLESIRSQPVESELIVVADSHAMAIELCRWIEGVADEYGAELYYLDAGQHDTGSPQLHLGYQMAGGQYIMNLGDDDVYVPGAFETIERVIRARGWMMPRLFKVELHPNEQRGNTQPVLLWDIPSIERFHVTGQSFVVANNKQHMGRWVDDVTFIRETVALYAGMVEWRAEVIARCY